MKTRYLLLFFGLYLTQFSYCQNLCKLIENDDFKAIELVVSEKVKALHKDKLNFSDNNERMDSLESWMQQFPCVKDAYWNKNDAFTLNTITTIHKLGVIFSLVDGTIEKCYSVQTYSYDYTKKHARKNHELKYLGTSDCAGFIDLRRTNDSINSANHLLNIHNGTIYLTMALEPLTRPNRPIKIHAYEEGQPIRVLLTIENRSDTIQKVIWPIYQNSGKKIIYFEWLDDKGNHLFTENRNVGLPNNEINPGDILTLGPGEKKSYAHTINGFCESGQNAIECHHHLGALKEGKYKLRAWYDPFVIDNACWQPIGKDSVQFRYEPAVEIIRTREYEWQRYKLKYKDSVSQEELSQSVYKVRIIGNGGTYYYMEGIGKYNAIGVVEEVKKGDNIVGDTIAISFRFEDGYPEIKKNIESLLEQNFQPGYWIYATNSTANYYQIFQDAAMNRFLKGKRNYQLIDHPKAIEEEEIILKLD